MATTRLAALLVLGACWTTGGPGKTAGDTSGLVRWTLDSDGTALAATADGKLVGPCGEIGTYDATSIRVAKGPPLLLSGIEVTGRRYQVIGMTVAAELADNGDVSQVYPDGTRAPRGHVTGLQGPADFARFRALFGALLVYKTTLSLTTGNDELAFEAGLDVSTWDIRSRTNHRWVSQRDGQSAPLDTERGPEDLDLSTITVTPHAPSYPVTGLPRGFDGYPVGSAVVEETKDGKLLWDGKIELATLHGRVACPAHDRAIAALLRVLLSSHTTVSALRERGAFPLPPPPPRPSSVH